MFTSRSPCISECDLYKIASVNITCTFINSIFVKIISIYYFWWIGRLFKKKVNLIFFLQWSYRRFPAYFRFARKMLREALAASDFNILCDEKYPIPRRVIGKHSNSGHEATGIMQRCICIGRTHRWHRVAWDHADRPR